MCLVQAKAISIDGHPNAAYNGVYTHVSTHEGWPVLKNDKGKYCYRHAPRDTWTLNDKFTPDKTYGRAMIVTEEGPLPVGSVLWRCWNSTWADHVLTMALQ